MSNNELGHLLARTHKDVTLFSYGESKVPCIILEEKRFDVIVKTMAGKAVSVDTNLNILQDGLGHVFVEVFLDFSQGELSEKLLLYANDHFDFFEALAETSMLALSSPRSEYGKSNVFMIQLPKKDRAINTLEIIKKGLKR